MPATTDSSEVRSAAAKHLFRASSLMMVAIAPLLALLDQSLRSRGTPFGAVSVQADAQRYAAMLHGWSERQRYDALLLQALELLFIAAYATTLGMSCWWAGRKAGHVAPHIARLASWAVWAAALSGVCDAVENVPIIMLLRDGALRYTLHLLSISCGRAKLAFACIALLYLVSALAATRRAKKATRA